ncbi:probable serine/threonine-protein kinase DDB_G0277165 [Anopheles bellator]|uniref:probable serine/threonine-protein kinase DDB_G0277165 n=1 Tax=Anopheles bellator TaxID=139047 RepID=UPI0026481167|nr:probable serine/threonine-protein kinase DDB_G0277165 [Anopheles bellator]
MIHVDETDPMGDVPPAFPYREVEIQRGLDPKQLYELSSELGRGKFGVVYKCKEKSTGVRLAAKFIQTVKKGDRRNIEREVHMMNVLHHAKIAQLYAAYEFDRTFCVMMELVEGGELFDRVLDEKFILTERACSIFMRQICDAVAYIHGNNIIHLDMKPENILCLTEAGNRIKIIDFGLAREYDPDNKLQVLFGTPEFVAPEVVNFEAISFATDMWSVGVIAYVLVSGLSPFAGEDDIQTMGNITIGRYDFLDEAFDNVSEEAIDFINRCLVKEQKERLSAEDALKHKWVKRKPQYTPTNRRPSITTFKPILLESNNNNTNEIDKDNLKELVGKWNETPNNRYTFEQDTENIISPAGDSVQLRRPTLPELSGLPTSGSRRGSIARDSSVEEVETIDNRSDTPNGNSSLDSLISYHNDHHDEGEDRTQRLICNGNVVPIVEASEQQRVESVQELSEGYASLETEEQQPKPNDTTNTDPEAAADRVDEIIAATDHSPQRVTPNASNAALEDCETDRAAVDSDRCSINGSGSISSYSDSIGSISSFSKLTNCRAAACEAFTKLAPDARPEPSGIVPSGHVPFDTTNTSSDTDTDVRSAYGLCLSTDRSPLTDKQADTSEAPSDTGPPTVGELGDRSTDLNEAPRAKVRDDLRKLSDLLKLSLTNVAKELEGSVTGDPFEAESSTAPLSPTVSSCSSSTAQELDSDLENLKTKVHTIRTSRAQNKLNELAQRPDFLANDPFKLPTFRFLPKSISLCNEDSVFKENYTKFCDRNASRESSVVAATEEVKSTTVDKVRKKSSTSSGMKKKKDSGEGAKTTTTTTTTTTTFASGGEGKMCPSTTVRKTIVKQQKVIVDEQESKPEPDTPTIGRRKPPLGQMKSIEASQAIGNSMSISTASVKRTKFRVNQMSSRDVPVAINPVAQRYLERSCGTMKAGGKPLLDDTNLALGKVLHPVNGGGPAVGNRVNRDTTETGTFDDSVTVNNLRNSALKLRSLSVDWDVVDAVENRSMKTINSFLKRHAVASSAVRQIQAQLEATVTHK